LKRQPAWQNREVKVVKAFERFWTDSEWSADERTGTIARLKERSRMPGDKVRGLTFATRRVWEWRVQDPKVGVLNMGLTVTQKAARAAVRRFVRTMPGKIRYVRAKR
jgi:hypothetical protein